MKKWSLLEHEQIIRHGDYALNRDTGYHFRAFAEQCDSIVYFIHPDYLKELKAILSKLSVPFVDGFAIIDATGMENMAIK